MYALFSDFYEDDTNIYPNYLLKLNPNGDIIDEIELTQYDEGNPWSLIVVDSIYLSLLQLFNPSDLQVLRGNLNTKAFEISTITNLPGNGPIVAFGWTTKGDSVVILSNKFSSIGSTQIIKYALSDFQQFPTIEEMLDYNGIVQNVIPTSDGSGRYLMMATGLNLLDNNFQVERRIGTDTMIGINGNVIAAIDSGYVAFSHILNVGAPENKWFGLCYVAPDYSIQKVTTFQVPTDEYMVPAINSCLDHDDESYFIASHKDVEMTLYTDTIKHLYYLGKYDKDLNQVWLKILGGDRKYLIAGVKADGQGGCYIHGMTRMWEYNYTTIPFLMRFNADGEITADQDPLSEPMFEFTILGNPGHDWFRYEFGARDRGYVMKIFDVQGREMAVRHLENGFDQVSAANWPDGVYIFQIFSPEGSSFQGGKWIKG